LPYNSSSPFSSGCNFLLVAFKKHTRNDAWKKQTESLFFHSPPPTQAFVGLGERQWTQDKRVRWSHQWVIVVRAAPHCYLWW
jgi:hypothetical protein